MATRYHLAGTTDFGAGASWHDGVYGASGAPASTDTLWLTEGADTISAGLSQAAVDLTALRVTDGFSGRVGAPGSSLTIAVQQTNTGIVEYAASGGYMYLAGGTNNIWKVRVKGAGKLFLTGGAVAGTGDAIEVYGGELDVADGCAIDGTSLDVYGGSTVVDYKGSDTITTLNIHSGTVVMRRVCTTVNLFGGTLVLQVEKAVLAATTINQRGGMYDHRAGGITTWNAYEGDATFANGIRPLTIATTNLFKTNILSRQNKTASVTYTTVNDVGGAEGSR